MLAGEVLNECGLADAGFAADDGGVTASCHHAAQRRGERLEKPLALKQLHGSALLLLRVRLGSRTRHPVLQSEEAGLHPPLLPPARSNV